ncbi:MAG TPA: YfhO family protein, partial [Thermoanaerobaculia bacterium]
LLLVGQRFFEMRGTYPTLPERALAPPLSIFSALPKTADPYRIVAAGDTFRPNAAALYGLEDVRGYESLVLDRFAETYPMWCRPQFASFNRVDDLTRPFLSFVNVRYGIADPATPALPGWALVARTREGSVFENPRALPRAFVPAKVRYQPDEKKQLAEMAETKDFGEVAWLGRPPHPNPLPEGEGANGRASVTVREVGTDLIVEADVRERTLVATSIPDWPGWRAKAGSADVPLATVNHAFVGFWLAPGRQVVRLHYLPSSFLLGTLLSAGAVIAVSLAAVLRRRRGLR